VPDVAASADPNYGAIIVLDGAQETVGGTSWSSPTWAGLCALINQARSNAGQSSLGLLGPHVYPLLGSPDYPSVYLDDFRDITSGNNATRVSGGDYSATAGYDMCTGLGAPLAQPLALMLTGSSGLVSVQNPMAVAEIAPGQNATFTVTVTGTTATYQWQRMPVGSTTWTNVSDGGAYSGSLVSTLTIADATTIMSGDQFQCMVTYGGNTVTTTPASVLVVDTPLTVATFAGKVGITGLGNGSAAEFNYPSGVAIDSSGNVYVADYGNNQIREIAPGGTVSTPYGNVNGSAGSGNGTGNSALFNGPNAIAVDGSNNIYIADTGNNLIRKISGGAVSTFAGTGGQFNSPEGVAVDGSGNVYVADTNNDVIRKITPSGGISILAGISGDAGYANGAATTVALFNGPTSVAVDSLGNVYVADFNNDVVRKISSGTVSTVAGKAGDAGYLDGLGSNALFNAPVGLGVDSSNNVYIADSLVPTIGSSAAGNCLLRKLTPTGVVSTLAGETGVAGSANGTGTSAQFYSIQAFAENSSGVVYIADTYNQTIRTGTASGIVSNSSTKIISLSGNLAFGDVTEDKTATSTLTIRNTGNATMTVTGITYPTGFSGNWASGSIASGSSQAVTVTFAPTAAATYGGNIVVNSNATSGSDFIAASGTGIAVTGTSVISLSGNLAFGNVGVGQKATSTLTISNTGNAGLTVTGIAYPAGFSGNWSSGSIPSGNSQAVTVTFAPAAAISYGGSIVVASNATTGSNSIATSGSGVIVPTEPMVETASATGVGATAATLNGEVNPEGFATSVYFQYGLTGTYGSATASMGEGVGTTNVPFAAAVSGLLPMTTYHYQAVASNTAGTVYGADEAFTTTAYSIEPVTTTGDAAAGISGAEFTALGSPAINANNYTAFQATLANGAGGVIATNNSGVWAQDSSGSRYLVARTGSVAPGTSSAVFMALSNPVYNSSEAVAFLARLKVASGEASAANADGIWSTSSGSLALVAREGGQAPGYPEGTMFKGFNSFALPDEGGVLLLATVSNGQRGIWAGNSTADLQLIVKQGDSAGGKTIANLTFLPTLPYVDGQTRSFAQGTGALVYHATFRDKTIGIVKLTGTTSQVVVLSQDAAPGVSGGRFSAFGSPALNANGDVAFEGTLVTGTEGVAASEDAGIWADDNTGTLRLVARTGGAAPGTGAKFQTLGNPVYNDNEAVAFRGTLKVVSGEAASTTAAGIWSNSGGTLALVARQGSQAPGCPAGATFKLFNALALPDQGGVIMLATLNGNSNAGVVAASNTGIWAVDSAGTLQLIVRKGDVLNGKSITGLSFLPLESHVGGQSRSFNQGTGDLTYKATFSDGTSAITTVVFP
jgi:hypothetical protein